MKKGLKILIIVSFLVALFIPKSVFALQMKVEKSADSIKPGQDVTVNIKTSGVSDSSKLQSYTMNLAFDNTKLDIKSTSGNNISDVNNSNPIVIKKTGGELTSDTSIATIVFTAKQGAKSGDANLTLTSSECTPNCENPQSSMVKVVALSSDATLSSLKIPNATLSPKFDKNITEYTTTIQDITEITVNAIASDSNAKIMISDNYKNLQKGDNDIKITVTSEDGKATKTYLIKVKLKMTPTDEEILKASANLIDLKVQGYNIDFTKELKKYTLTVPYKVTKLKINAEAENKNATVEITGNNKFLVGRNAVKINVTSEDEQNKETYTLNVIRSKQKKKIVQTCPDTTSNREWIMFTICTLLTFTLGIVLGYYLSKKEVLKKIFKKKEKKDEEKLSDTIEVPNVKNTKSKK